MEWSGNPEQSSTPATAESVSACSIPHMDHALETTGGNPSVFTSTRFSTLPMRVQIFVARHDGRGPLRSASSRRAMEAQRAVRPSAKRLAQKAHPARCGPQIPPSARALACELTPPAPRRSTPATSPSVLSAFGTAYSEMHTEECEHYGSRWSITPIDPCPASGRHQMGTGPRPRGLPPAGSLPPARTEKRRAVACSALSPCG